MAHKFLWPLNPKNNPDQNPPLCTPLIPSGRQLLGCGVSVWSHLGPNPNRNPIYIPQPTPNSIYLTESTIDPQLPICPHLSPPWNLQHWCGFSPEDVFGPNPYPSEGSFLMKTQFQSLTTARTWVQESVQKYSAWNLENHHVICKVRLQLH